jgi:hypothetical protein
MVRSGDFREDLFARVSVLREQGLSPEALELDLLVQVPERRRGNKTHAARLPSLTRGTLRYRIETLGLGEQCLARLAGMRACGEASQSPLCFRDSVPAWPGSGRASPRLRDGFDFGGLHGRPPGLGDFSARISNAEVGTKSAVRLSGAAADAAVVVNRTGSGTPRSER